MNYNLKDLNFETIDLSVQGAAELYVNLTGLTFSRRTVEDLGYPQYVKIMMDRSEKIFAIQACRQDSDKAYKFAKAKNDQKSGVSLNSNTLRSIVRNLASDWDPEVRYKVNGTFFSEERIMLFDLKAAEPQPEFRANTKN